MHNNKKKLGKARPSDAVKAIKDPYRLLVESITDYAIYMLDPQGIGAQGYLFGRATSGERVQELIGGQLHSSLARWPLGTNKGPAEHGADEPPAPPITLRA